MPDAIDLAHVPLFEVGDLQVEPSSRSIRAAEAEIIVEPRVLQLLVALSQAEGRVLSRDDLIQRVWGGRAVGENAIHRAVSRLRHIAKSLGKGCFEIEVVRGVGYRLVSNGQCRAAPTESTRASAGQAGMEPVAPLLRKSRLIAVGLALLTATFVGAWGFDRRDDGGLTVAINTSGSSTSGPSGQLARQLAMDLREIGVVDRLEVDGTRGVFGFARSFRGRSIRIVLDVAQGHNTHLRLYWAGSDSAVWSAQFPPHAGKDESVRRQMAAGVAVALQCLRKASGGGLSKDAAGLYLQACEKADSAPSIERLSVLRRLARSNPRSAFTWAELSATEALLAQFMVSNSLHSADAATLTNAAREHLKRAEELDADAAATAIARAMVSELDEPTAWGSRLNVYDLAIASHPQASDLYSFRSQELMRVGRAREAISDIRKATELEPSSPLHRAQLIATLAYQGLHGAAERELSEAMRLWPASSRLADARHRIDLHYGNPADAIARLEAEGLPSISRPVWRAYLLARQNPTAHNIRSAITLSESMYQRRQAGIFLYLQILGQFGEVGRAYDLLLGQPSAASILHADPTVLFRSQLDSLRRDRRFMQVAAQLGLTAFWEETNQWPDFCLTPDLPYDCKSEAG